MSDYRFLRAFWPIIGTLRFHWQVLPPWFHNGLSFLAGRWPVLLFITLMLACYVAGLSLSWYLATCIYVMAWFIVRQLDLNRKTEQLLQEKDDLLRIKSRSLDELRGIMEKHGFLISPGTSAPVEVPAFLHMRPAVSEAAQERPRLLN